MANIQAMVVNVEVDDLESAIPLYQELADTDAVNRFPYQDLQLAKVGPFLLISGQLEHHPTQHATVIVSSLDPVQTALKKAGGEILEGPGQVPNGTRIVARHPDGYVFEYIQPS